ncbi:putative defense protein Hdd11-like [Harmonia axyridis]|uniref:putative defense protein Hdd11-like n=1 Tax=Harmonia axyridis TaxID=115357 RepID=UPI001E27646C|nr:putative defense protein Hdd11-like [Harmonia axyridis]XP_045479925.1 putative defense protein Hdd11-like [Harmonia axyridis]XP_045479926.1 putative defense protein Hdd11-like [Harmonia axyridis]
MKKSVCLLFLLGAVISTWAYPSGAPPNLVCDSMAVKHGIHDPQSSKIPYTVSIVQPDLSPEEETDIIISGDDFKGFFIQVRSGDKAVGSFVTSPEYQDYQTMTCHNHRDSAAIQNDASVKKKVILRWKAPQEKGELKVYITMVKEFATFWNKIEAGTLRVK